MSVIEFPNPPSARDASEDGASPVSSQPMLPQAGEASIAAGIQSGHPRIDRSALGAPQAAGAGCEPTLSQQWADAVRWGRYQEADALLKQLFASVFAPVNPENAEHWEKMIRSRPPRLPEHEQDARDYQEERDGDFYR